MEDVGPPILSRRKSIAGPWMRASTGISADHRPEDDDFEPEVKLPATSPMNIPPPLTRANTAGGGWFGNWFTRRTSITSPPTTDPSPISIFRRAQASGSYSDSIVPHDDNHTNLAASAPQIAPPSSNSRDFLFNSTGSVKPAALNTTTSDAGTTNVPPLTRRRSETGLGSSSSSKKEATPSSSPVIDNDVRQGPIETDLFWMVLRDIGE